MVPWLVATVWSVGGPPLVAQGFPRARAGEFEVRGFDIALDGGWRKSAAALRTARRVALDARALSRLNAPIFGIRGTFRIPVVPIVYADVAMPFSRAAINAVFFDPAPLDRPYSVRSFYRSASRDQLNLDGRVFDPVTLPGAAAFYEDGCNGVGIYGPCPARARSRMADLLLGALDAISTGPGADTVWNQFDNDGPDGISNSGDDDGIIDLVTFLQPRLDGACGTDAIWAHRYVIRGWNGGAMYATRTPRRNAVGMPMPGQFLRVDSYTMQSVRGGATSCSPDALMPIGTVAHETAHAFGLPDLYDTDRVNGTEGIGEWSLMGAGNYATPSSPSSFDAWSLVQLGWVSVDTIGNGRTILARAVQQSDTVYHVASDVPGVYFLLENRQAAGPDAAMMSTMFARPKGPGLLIWRIDDTRITTGLGSNAVNTGSRPGVALIQADGLEQLRSPLANVRNRGDAGDPWPGTSIRTTFGLMSRPAATNWDAAPLGLRIDHILAVAGGRVTLRATRGPATLIASTSPAGRVNVNGQLFSEWREVLASGDQLAITVDSMQWSAGGRTVAQFVNWSDGSPRDRTLVASGARPDTLLAQFIVRHRLRASTTSGGSVSGGPDASDFLIAGQVVHLRATSDSGAAFLRWTGDTVATGVKLDLVMTRPWSVTAEFITPVEVSPAVAAAALLGGPALPPTTAVYLDTIGNRNGVYDLGDLLAWMRFTRQSLPPTLLRATREASPR
ncbi:MAG: M6 family metalloprotease domain-containing protein [Gemmatimonadales bacterium]|nr:M6 family metalloprotease domain-containing protein [Gemmatimonadales bacterium]